MEGRNKMILPDLFLKKPENQLGRDFPRFIETYDKQRFAGLRANSIKISPTALKELLPFLEKAIPWSRDGYYYDDEKVRPAKKPYYYAGLYYIQEPSAMFPVELLKVKPGERVLDLCAAPGGKSIQLAAHLGGDGLLVSNDLNPQRAKVLLKNIERYGITNAIVLNETPEKIAEVFSEFFDKILVDAPCSGEGMFRKEPEMAKAWSPEEVTKYVGWQKDILKFIPKLLRPEGEIVYSTCTFSKEENEEQISQFLSQHEDFTLVATHRLWPHEIEGEGHFAAKLERQSVRNAENDSTPITKNSWGENSAPTKISLSESALDLINEFSEQIWHQPELWQEWLPQGGQVVERSGHIIWESLTLPSLRGLKVLRSGWLLGTIEKKRFRPSIAFALGLSSKAVKLAKQHCELAGKSEEGYLMAIRYLRGETLQQEGVTWAKGWHLVSLDGFPLGWAKSAGNWLKNEYPPGWRWVD